MWFKFPDGTESITIQQQPFVVEAKDPDSHAYFRAPDHFAPLILDLPGFTHSVPPEGSTDLGDLSADNPDQVLAVEQLAGQLSAVKAENEALRAALAETKAERDDLKLAKYEAEQEIERLKNPEPEEAGASGGGTMDNNPSKTKK